MAKKPARTAGIGPLPASIYIAGHCFSVDLVALEDKYGDCDIAERKIRINPDKPLDLQWQTLFHEVCHAVLGIGGLAEMLDEKEEEAIVLALDNLLWPLVDFR
jgi:hypothetical protein